MSSPKPKSKKNFLFPKLGAKAKAQEEESKPDAEHETSNEAPVSDALDPSNEDVELNKEETEQHDVSPPAKSKHSFLPKKLFSGHKTKPNVEEPNKTEDDGALNDACDGSEDEVIGSSKDWSVEINLGKTAKIADEEDSKEEEGSDRDDEVNQVKEAVASSAPSEQPTDSPTNEGDVNPKFVDAREEVKKKKKDDDDIDLSELKTKFMKMLRRKKKPLESTEGECKEEVSQGCETLKSRSIEDGATNGGEDPCPETNEGKEDNTENEVTTDANIVKDDEIIDPTASDAKFLKTSPSDENSAKTSTSPSPTTKEEADGEPGDAVKIDVDVKETNVGKSSNDGATKSSLLKSKFKKIFKSSASSAIITSGAIAATKEVDDDKEGDITESKRDLPSDVNDVLTTNNDVQTDGNQITTHADSGSKPETNVTSDAESKKGKGLKSKIMKKFFRSEGEAECSKDGESKIGDVAKSESLPSKAGADGDSTKQPEKNSNVESMPSNLVVDSGAIALAESIVNMGDANLRCEQEAANAEKNSHVPQMKDDTTENNDLDVLKAPPENGQQDNETDEKSGTHNDDESDNESAKDDRQFEKQSRCGFGDGIHDALMHAGQLMYDTCGDPDFGTAKKMLGIMEIGENAMCHCLGTSPPDKDD